MFLKRVTVCGFKSFAEKVDFDFGPGVTCIVGPNGCGKSNVVDAFKWVLGEQSAKSLRGRQMLDMIFSGSSSRRSSGLAQVDLVFDNADRSLPIDFQEVMVSRKLYRSGESEYLLNNETTRLKDIRELFMDTGVGVESYSVIEQGRVDSLLQSNPLERRMIFEEAAGISKYKARKREAERKLERTQQNLLRVADIVEELEKRLRSVKLAAGKARSYKEYEARLNELRSSFALAEYHRFSEQVHRFTHGVTELTDQSTAFRTDIDRLETLESQTTLQLDRVAEEIGEADSLLIRSKAEYEGQTTRIETARKRIEEQESLRESARQRLDADSGRLADRQRELKEVRDSAVSLQEQTQELHSTIDELHENDRGLARELTQAQAILEDEKAGIIDLLRKSAQVHNEIIRLNTHRESLVGQKGRLAVRDAQIASELTVTLEHKAGLEIKVREVETLIVEETTRLGEKKSEAVRINGVRQQLVDELASTKERRSAMLSRKDVLHDLQRKMDGIGSGVRHVLDHRDFSEDPALSDVLGLIADLFETDAEHASIIEAALGDADQHLVVSNLPNLLAREDTLATLPGRLIALCMDRMPPIVNERDFSQQDGFVARAVDLVRFSPEHEQIARHLLGKTIVVEDLAAARAMALLDVSGHRFVTRHGEVVEPDGRVLLGPPASQAGLISRRAELRDIEDQLSEIDGRIESLADQLNRTQAEVTHLDAVQQELRTAIYECNTAKVEASAALQGIRETVGRLTHEQPLILHEVTLIEHQIGEVLEKSAAGGQSLDELERQNKNRETEVEKHQQRIDELVTTRRQVQEHLTESRVSLGQLTEKRAAAAEAINNLQRALRDLETSVQSAAQDIEQCEARITDSQAAIVGAEERMTNLAEQIRTLDSRTTQLRQSRETLRMEFESTGGKIKAARSELEAVEARLQECRMSLAETTVRRDELAARIRDEMAIDLADRYENYQHEDQNWEAVEAQISELREKLARLGNVNFDAITELEELEQRHGFLTGQRDDLNESQRQLQQLIDRLNQESHTRFIESFEQIRGHFRAMFRKLFGGGRADIVLEDPNNALECGIEIVAQPPGKELQILSLMSGGEKSMTAIALLMSIFQSKPAPFTILDEVDAALDEANNNRFNQIVQEFVASTQFLIITHSKRTMNIADRLYGITMQEPGVSTRVSVQFDAATNAA